MIEIIEYLLENGYHFGVLCRIEHITFEPKLSDEISATFRPLTLFYLAGYTFESAYVQKNALIFEAGFGPDNLGSHVNVPLLDIIQITLDDTPIFVNSTAKHVDNGTLVRSEGVQDNALQNSLEALMSNPENQRLFKKK
jgi:hypothetical protein